MKPNRNAQGFEQRGSSLPCVCLSNGFGFRANKKINKLQWSFQNTKAAKRRNTLIIEAFLSTNSLGKCTLSVFKEQDDEQLSAVPAQKLEDRHGCFRLYPIWCVLSECSFVSNLSVRNCLSRSQVTLVCLFLDLCRRFRCIHCAELQYERLMSRRNDCCRKMWKRVSNNEKGIIWYEFVLLYLVGLFQNFLGKCLTHSCIKVLK